MTTTTEKPANKTNDKILNTAATSKPIPPTDYPFISGLRQLGMNAILLDGKIGLTPADKVTPKLLDIAMKNRQAIIAEIESIFRASSADQAADAVACNVPSAEVSDQWADPRHDMNRLELTLMAMFYHCANIGWKHTRYWAGPESKTQPPARPYCYVNPVLLNANDNGSGEFIYWPMLADTDGTDYVWVIPEALYTKAQRKQQKCFAEENTETGGLR